MGENLLPRVFRFPYPCPVYACNPHYNKTGEFVAWLQTGSISFVSHAKVTFAEIVDVCTLVREFGVQWMFSAVHQFPLAKSAKYTVLVNRLAYPVVHEHFKDEYTLRLTRISFVPLKF